MKYVLSRKVWLTARDKKYYISRDSNDYFEVSESVFILAGKFLRPQVKEKIINAYESPSIISSTLDSLIKIKILIPLQKDKPSLIKDLTTQFRHKKVKVYSDKKISVNVLKKYCDRIDNLLDNIKIKFKLELKKINVCIYHNRDTFKKTASQYMPEWATGFVCQDCLIQLTDVLGYLSSDNSNRNLAHEIGHLLIFNYCRRLPNWFTEGISEYIACALFPKIKYQLNKNSGTLSFFFKNEDQMLITKNSNIPLKNNLYYEAGRFISHILRRHSFLELLMAVNEYDLKSSFHRYLKQKDFIK